MRPRASGSLVDLCRRMPPATARLLGGATEHGRPARALLALLVVTVLGVGGYVAGRAMTDPTVDRHVESADPTAPYDDGRSTHPAGASTSDDPPADGHRAKPSASATERSEPPSPVTATPQAPRPSLPSATGSPSTGAATPSTSPSTSPSASPSTSPPETEATASATPEDTTPPQTSVSEDFPAPDAALFTFSANEPATFTCSLDGAAYTPCGSPLPYLDLAAGWHTLAVRATDAAGNVDQTPAETGWHSHEGAA